METNAVGVTVTVASTVGAWTPKNVRQKGATSDWSCSPKSTRRLSEGLHRVHRAAALETRAAACNKRRPPVLKETIFGRSFVKRVTVLCEE